MADPLSIVSTLAALSSYAMLNRRQRALKHANDSSIEQEHGGSAKWGLIQVHPPEHRIAQQAGVDIIFVHGLLGDPIQTWTAETGGFWPRDYLPCDIKNARVLTFGYSALLGDGLSTSIKGLGQLLLGTICRDREESGALGRPLVFVAHSLGGLIVKAALVYAHRSIDQHALSVNEATKMIVFLGTPHAGFSKTSWKETVAVIQTALVSEDFSSYQKAKSTVKSLEDDSMLTVSRAFHDMEQDADVEILSCYETFRTSTKRGRIMVVGRDVATIGIPNERVHHLNANHANMCKFNSRNDSGYLYITNCIRRLLALDHESVASIEHLRIIKRQNSDDESQNPGFGESDGNVDLFEKEHQFMKFLRTELLEEEMIPDIYPGTCDWVFQSSQWKGRDSSPKSLCIIGPSGMGKTVLVKYLASELRRAAEKKNETATRRQAGAQLTDASLSFMEMAEFQSKAHVLSYYFDARVLSRASGVTLVKSMLHQMLTTDRNLFRHVYGRPMFSNHEAIFKGFAEVLEVMIGDPAVTTVEIIIDGLDECSESAIGEVDNLMSRLVEISSVKLITTCKSSVKDKFRSLSSVSQLDIAHDSKLKAKEMEKFILSGADKLACERKLPPDLRQDIQRHLLDQSQGNFLWVRLVLYHLGCQKTISSTRKALAMLPVKVDFEFIFSTLLNSVSDFDQSTLIRALYFVINAKTPLSIEALGSLLALARMEDKAIPSLTDIQENLILDLDLDLRRFQPLLHVIDGKVTLVHNIVRQFLSTERNISRFCDTFEAHKMHEGSAHQSIPTMRHVNAIMAELCLKYLLAECKASNTLVGDAFGLLYYASVHWAEHVCEAGDVFSEHLATPVKALLMTALRDSWIAYYRSLDSLRQRLVPSDSNPAFILSTLDICGDLVRHIQLPVNAFWKTDEDGRLPLHFAAANNSLNSIEWILKLPRLPDSSFDRMIDKEDNRGLTPLVIAIKYGNLDATRVLLGNFEKADVLRQRLGEIAAENGHRDIFLLLWEAGSIPHSTPAERLSALRQAMILNCTAVVRNLIGSLEVSDATKKTSKDRSLLHWAVAERNVDIVKILIPYIGVNVVDSKGTSPLHIAAENGDDDIVKALLRKGARSNITNKEGQSPLHLASQKGYPVVVSELLKNEASVKLASVKLVDNKGRLATHYAASIGQDQILRLLLRAGSNVLAGDADGNTILHLAAEAGHEGTVIMALSHSADVNARNSDGKTPLHRAAMSGNMDIIWLLVYHGSDPNCVDNSGVTPLHTASQLGYDIIVAELLKFGGEPNRADNRGRTPLHYVCDSKSPSDEVLKCLIDSGARIDVLDNDGNTPRAAAMAQRNFAVVAWLDRERTKFGPRLITA